jgi:hypothetical protein
MYFDAGPWPPRLTHGPYIYRLTDEYNPYIRLAASSEGGSKTDTINNNSCTSSTIQQNSTQFTIIRTKTSYNCSKLVTSHTNEIQVTKRN